MEKIRIRDREVKDDWDFPCYGITSSGKTLVYFTKREHGVCIATEIEDCNTGEVDDDWDMNLFTAIPKGKTIEIDT